MYYLFNKKIDLNYVIIRLISKTSSIQSSHHRYIRITVFVLNIMYSKLKYNITSDQSETYDKSSKKKYREIFTMALCQCLVIRKLSHKNNNNVFSKNPFYFISLQSFVPHGIKSSPSPHSTSTILLSLLCSVFFFFSLFSNHICLHTLALPLFQLPFIGVLNYFQVPMTSLFHILYLLLTEQSFRIIRFQL